MLLTCIRSIHKCRNITAVVCHRFNTTTFSRTQSMRSRACLSAEFFARWWQKENVRRTANGPECSLSTSMKARTHYLTGEPALLCRCRFVRSTHTRWRTRTKARPERLRPARSTTSSWGWQTGSTLKINYKFSIYIYNFYWYYYTFISL